MAIYLIDGKPGAGKTLYAISHFIKEFHDKVDNSFVPKRDFILVSNIDNLKLPHLSLTDEISACNNNPKEYFSIDNQKKLFEERGEIIYLIDEAQFIFDRKFYDKEVFNWFQYHRHYEQTIYLTSQNAMNLPKEIQVLVEFIIRAQPRSKSISDSYFHYTLLTDGQKVGTDKVLARKYLFDLYSSSKGSGKNKVKRPWVKPILIGVGVALFIGYFALNFLIKKYSSTPTPVPSSTQNTTQQTKPYQSRPSNNRPAPEQYQEDPTPLTPSLQEEEIIYDVVQLSSFVLFHGDGSPPTVKILHKGVYTLETFPYPVYKQGDFFYARIPREFNDEDEYQSFALHPQDLAFQE